MTATLFRLWESWRRKWEDDKDWLKRKGRKNEESRRRSNLTSLKKILPTISIEPLLYLAVIVFNHYFDFKKDKERRKLEKQKDVENSLLLFRGIPYFTTIYFVYVDMKRGFKFLILPKNYLSYPCRKLTFQNHISINVQDGFLRSLLAKFNFIDSELYLIPI